ncbi:MAG: exodeoxyribonuclease III, partial [Candidatus Saccharibacteria bacterium]|nr:exodeoxyribonuclease III [Pseudorhodobacter sp.]
INGIIARHDALLAWLETAQADVVCLQETKKIDADFPRDAFESLGYRVELHGMKSFNGVAILSRLPLEDVTRRLPGNDADEHTRWIEATVIGRRPVRVTSLYLPNGNPAPGPKYDYKLAWMERMRLRVADLLKTEEPLVFCGDYNIIPQAIDAANPKDWLTDALYLPESRDAFQRIVNLGLTEAFRARNQGAGQYSYWDFQRGAWDRNNGIRIDHHLLSPQAADLLIDVGIDKQVRGGEKPSDHVPVWIELDA